LKNEKRKIKLKNRVGTVNEDPETREEPMVVETVHGDHGTQEESIVATNEASEDKPYEFGDRRGQLRSEQKSGVSFSRDSCMSTNLTPDLEAILYDTLIRQLSQHLQLCCFCMNDKPNYTELF
jgi:hypothetical protein